MENFIVFRIGEQDKILECHSYQEGVAMLLDLSIHENIRPVGVYCSQLSYLIRTSRVGWDRTNNQAVDRQSLAK